MSLKSDAHTTELLRVEIERQRNTAEIQVNNEIIAELTGNDAKIKYSKKLEYRNSDLEYSNRILTQLISNLKKLR